MEDMVLTKGLEGGICSEVIGVAAVRSSAIAAGVALVGGDHWSGLGGLLMAGLGRCRGGDSTAGEESNTSEDVGELHFDRIDGFKLRKEDKFDGCLGWK